MATLAAIAGIYIVLSSRAATATCSSVSQYGITWTFDKTYPCGQFVNGDWWVALNAGDTGVKINTITPAYSGGQNGWEVNPVYSGSQGFDQDIGGFSASLVPALPYLAQPNKSIVKATTASGGCPNNIGCL
ncbi:MAG TPA: hypothetical protein VMR98_03090, partial [Candidatus Polarisedimenticolaceae bacterium]|nr:hypothetical protein [Candidatus Polarisedimenticolaceae bacterium]